MPIIKVPYTIYDMKGWDATGTKWVYWSTTDPTATPAVTTPAAAGAITNKQVIGVR